MKVSVFSVCVFFFSVTVSRGLMMLLEEERLCSCVIRDYDMTALWYCESCKNSSMI